MNLTPTAYMNYNIANVRHNGAPVQSRTTVQLGANNIGIDYGGFDTTGYCVINFLGSTKNYVRAIIPQFDLEHFGTHAIDITQNAAEHTMHSCDNVRGFSLRQINGQYIDGRMSSSASRTECEIEISYQAPLLSSRIRSWISLIRLNFNTGRLEIIIETAQFEMQNINPFNLDEAEIFERAQFGGEYVRFYDPAHEDTLRKKCGECNISYLETKRNRIRNNLITRIRSRAEPVVSKEENECTAIESLREIISESEFRRYVKYGFICIAVNDKTYQIFRNNPHTRVWQHGKLIEELCVRIQDFNIPPTDNVIAIATMVQSDEIAFKKLANVYSMKAA